MEENGVCGPVSGPITMWWLNAYVSYIHVKTVWKISKGAVSWSGDSWVWVWHFERRCIYRLLTILQRSREPSNLSFSLCFEKQFVWVLAEMSILIFSSYDFVKWKRQQIFNFWYWKDHSIAQTSSSLER